MPYEMALPRFAHAMTEGEIAQWCKKVGDRVEDGEVLFDIITEKVTIPVESPVSGTIKEITVAEGETVSVGITVAIIDTEE